MTLTVHTLAGKTSSGCSGWEPAGVAAEGPCSVRCWTGQQAPCPRRSRRLCPAPSVKPPPRLPASLVSRSSPASRAPAARCDCPTKPAPRCAACPQVFRGTTKHAPDECRFLLTVAGNGHLRSFWKPVFTAGHGQRGGRRDQGGPGLGLGLHMQHMATRCQRAPQGQTQKLSVTLKQCPKYRRPVTTR